MKKRIFLLSLLLVLFSLSVLLCACEETALAEFEYTLREDGRAILTAYTGKDTAVTVPAEIDGYSVAELSGTFRQNGTVTSVTVPEGVEVIRNYAFFECVSLASVTLPQSLTELGDSVFRDCSALTELFLPDSVKQIGSNALACPNLESIRLPSDMEFMNGNAFGAPDIPSLAHTEYGNGKYLGNEEDPYIFLWNGLHENITALEIHEDTRFLGSVCGGYNGLTEVVIPEGIQSIPQFSFYECRNLRKVTLPSTVTEIGSYAFGYCPALEEVSFPEGLTVIEGYAFSACTGLSDIDLPDGLKWVGAGAFSYTAHDNSNENHDEYDVHYLGGVLLFAPKSIAGAYTVKEGTVLIADESFASSVLLEKVILPEGVERICAHAFAGCSRLTEITLPQSLTAVDMSAFVSCRNLKVLRYSGTVAKWNALEKENWYYGMGDYTIYCTDGEVTLPREEE